MQRLAYSFVIQFAWLRPGALRRIVVAHAQRGQIADYLRLSGLGRRLHVEHRSTIRACLSGTAGNAIAPVVSAFGLTSGERPGCHHCPIPRSCPAASPCSGARPADSKITRIWDRGGIVAGLEFAAAAIRARELSLARPAQALCGPHRRSPLRTWPRACWTGWAGSCRWAAVRSRRARPPRCMVILPESAGLRWSAFGLEAPGVAAGGR